MTKFNKATGDIAQFYKLIEIYDEIESLKKAKMGYKILQLIQAFSI